MDQMILYKYLPPQRLNVLKKRKIRFTQPGDFNDPFEFHPQIQSLASTEETISFLEEHFDELVASELAGYSALAPPLPQSKLKQILSDMKPMAPLLHHLLEPPMLKRVSAWISRFFNEKVGVLCLSELKDSLLMWGHYAENHKGFVIGFDSDNIFFSKKNNASDEFGFLRPVDYQSYRPVVTLASSTSNAWFQTKLTSGHTKKNGELYVCYPRRSRPTIVRHFRFVSLSSRQTPYEK